MNVVALTVPVHPRNLEVVREVTDQDALLTTVVCTLVDQGDVDPLPVLLRFLKKDPVALRDGFARVVGQAQ